MWNFKIEAIKNMFTNGFQMDCLKKTVAIDLKVSKLFALHARVLREESNSWT